MSPVLSIEFDREVTIGSGNIYVYNEDGTTFDLTIPARTGKFNTVNSVLSIDELNRVLTIDLSNQTLPNNTELYVEIQNTVILVDGTNWPDLSPWFFTTEVEPDPLRMNTASLSPANSSVEVPRAPTLEVSFNQAIT